MRRISPRRSYVPRPRGPRAIWRGSLGMCSAIGRFTTAGWHGARRILEEVGDNGAEHGWVLIISSYSEPDAKVRRNPCREAIAIGREWRFQYRDRGFVLSRCSVSHDRADRRRPGASRRVNGGTVCRRADRDRTMDNLFCGLFWALRTGQRCLARRPWMRAASEVMASRNAVAAFCRAHYGGILTAAGRWQEAEVQLVDAARHFDQGMPQRRAAAIIRLADLRVRQGRLEEAGQLLKGLEQHPDAVRVLAAFHLARGDVALARDLLERATEGSATKLRPWARPA